MYLYRTFPSFIIFLSIVIIFSLGLFRFPLNLFGLHEKYSLIDYHFSNKTNKTIKYNQKKLQILKDEILEQVKSFEENVDFQIFNFNYDLMKKDYLTLIENYNDKDKDLKNNNISNYFYSQKSIKDNNLGRNVKICTKNNNRKKEHSIIRNLTVFEETVKFNNLRYTMKLFEYSIITKSSNKVILLTNENLINILNSYKLPFNSSNNILRNFDYYLNAELFHNFNNIKLKKRLTEKEIKILEDSYVSILVYFNFPDEKHVKLIRKIITKIIIPFHNRVIAIYFKPGRLEFCRRYMPCNVFDCIKFQKTRFSMNEIIQMHENLSKHIILQVKNHVKSNNDVVISIEKYHTWILEHLRKNNALSN